MCGDPLEIVTTDPALSPRPRASAGADQGDGGPGVEPDGLEELGLADGIERERVGSAADGADDQVDPAERVDGLVDQHGHGRLGVHRPDDPDHAQSLGPHGGLGRGHPARIPPVDHDGGAPAGEPQGTGSPDARISGGTGHDGHPAREPLVTSHGRVPRRLWCRVGVSHARQCVPRRRHSDTPEATRIESQPFGSTAASSMAFMIGPAIPAPVSTKF